MLRSIEIDEVDSVFCIDEASLEVTVNDSPALDQIRTCAKGWILTIGIYAWKDEKLHIVIGATAAEKSGKRVDDRVINTVEESRPVEGDECGSILLWLSKYDRWISKCSGNPVSFASHLIEE